MSKENNLHDFLTDIADAVREKKGTSDPINAQMLSEEIRSIESGGSVNTFADTMIDTTGEGTKQITTVIVAEGVTELKDIAYYRAGFLMAINLPKSLVKIGSKSIEYCDNLKRIDIPASVTYIGDEAFYGNSLMEYANIPKGVSEVPALVFGECRKLRAVYFEERESVPVLKNVNAFQLTSCKIVVPDNLYDEWIVATNWSTYADRIVKESEYVEPTTE